MNRASVLALAVLVGCGTAPQTNGAVGSTSGAGGFGGSGGVTSADAMSVSSGAGGHGGAVADAGAMETAEASLAVSSASGQPCDAADGGCE